MDPLVKKVVDTGISKGVDFSEISSAMYNSGAGENQVLQAQEYYNQVKKKSPSVAGVSPSISGRTPSSLELAPVKVKGQGNPNDPSGLYGQVEEANRRINTANRIYNVLSKKGELSPKEIESARKDYQEYRSFYPNLPIDPSKDVGLLTDNIARDRTNIKAKSQPDESNYRRFMDYVYQSSPGGENGFLATILRGTEKIAGSIVSDLGAINDATDAFYSSVFGEETAENYKKTFKDTPLEPGAISRLGKGMAEQWNENTKKIASNWDMTEEQYEKGPGEALLEGDFSTAGKGIAIGLLHTMPELIATALLLRFKGPALAGEVITANLIRKGTPKWIAGAAGRARAMAPTTLPLYTGANYAEVLDDPEFTTGEKLLYAVGSAVGSTLAESVGGFGEYFLGGAAKKQAVDQVKSSIMKSIGRGTVDMLNAAGVEGAEEVLDGGIQQALGIALGDRKFDANSLLDGFLIGTTTGGGTNLISKSPSLIGLSSDMLTTIKITDELSKIQGALSDPSLSDVERDLLTNRARVANNEIRRAKNNAAIFFQNYTPEDLQETMTLNSEIRRQIDSMPSFKTDEAKSAAIQSVKDSVARLKQIESKYDSQKKQQVQGAVQAGAQPGGVPVEGAGTAATAPGGVLQNVGQTQEEQVAQQRTEQASAFNVRPRLKKMKVTAKNAPGAYKMMMDALSNYTDEFLQQNKTDRASVERGIKSLFDVISSLDAKGRTVEIDVMGSIDEANKLFGFEINEVDGKFKVSSKIPGANRVFDTKEGADAYTKRVLYRGVNMMSDGGDVKISVLLPAMLDNTGYHEALHSLEVFDDKSADKLVVSLMNAIKKLPVLDGRMIAFMESYRGKPEPERNSEYLAELGSMISSGEISVEIRDSVIKSLTKSFLDFFKNMIGSDVDVTPTAEQLARTFNDIAEKLGRGEKQPPYRKTRKKGEESGAVDRAKVRFQGIESEISNLPTNEQKRAKELFQLIGENAELTQDVRDNLQVARYMEDDGKDVENIRMATGWERGKDGMWRYEIQDLEFKKKIGRFEEDLNQVIKSAKNGNLEQYDLNELIDSDLFYFYPSLNNTSVILSRRLVVGFQDVLGGAEGSYYKEGKRGIIAIKAKEDLTIEKLRLILVHEIQHAIQDIENFAKGNYGVSMQDEVAAEKEIKLLDNKIGVSTQIIRDGNDSFLSENINELSDSEKSAYKEILDYSKSASMPILDAAKVWDKIWKKDKDTQKNILKQNERYVKTAGEVESRNVEARIGMTPEQRREITLEKTEDVSRAEQIVFFDNSYGQAFQSIEASQPKFQLSGMSTNKFTDYLSTKYGVNLDIVGSLGKDGITLSRIIVPKENRKSGIGSSIMNEIIDYADANNERILLTPSDSFGGNVERLKKFYKNLGFIENKGRNRDFTTKESMYRNPVPKAASNFKGLSKRLSGDALLNAQDLSNELLDNGAKIDADGLVTVYHRTTDDKKAQIEQSGIMLGLEDGLFFSTKESGQAEGYGDAVIQLRIPIEKLQLDDTFGDEAHVRIPTSKPRQSVDVSAYLTQPKFQAIESEREVITLNDGKKITPTVIDGSTVFYHASSKKRIGRLRPNNAIQWGKAIYFSPSREDVVYEFGDENVTEVRLNLSNPVYTNAPDFSKVANRAVEIYTEEQIKKGAERESYGLDDIEDGYYFGEAAKQLGYDAIIDLNPNNYGGEIAVIDEGAVIYPEDIKSISPPKGKNDSILFQLIGERGAEGIQMVKDNLAIAKQMEAEGKDAKTIFLATGWEKDVRDKGQWKYDLPDGKLKGALLIDRSPKDVFQVEEKLSDVFESDGLFSAYPELSNIKIAYSQEADNGASYNGQTKTITLNAGVYATKSQISLGERRSILIHEIQHAIQDIEGFARGGNTQSIGRKLYDTLGVGRKYQTMLQDAYSSKGVKKERLLKEAKEYLESEKNRLSEEAYKKYKRLAGEAEARNAQRRAEMTPEQRKQTMISESELLEGVRPEDKIYLYEGGVQQSIQYLEQSDFDSDGTVKDSAIKEIEQERNAIEIDSKLMSLDYTLRRPGENTLVFVPINKLLQRHAKDNPSYDVTKKGNQIGNRVQKAKEFLINYLSDSSFINPKTGERTKATKVTYEPSVVGLYGGKLSFEDGRHRVLAAQEMGATAVAVEIPKAQVKTFKEELGVVDKKEWLKAPNGKDTNLTPDQWVTVRTKRFKDWFGDWQNNPENASKVVDANGEPMVVYHGTDADFDVFDNQKKGSRGGLREMFWAFTTNKKVAELYGSGYTGKSKPNIVPVFLNIRQMPVYDNGGNYYRELRVDAGYKFVDIFQLQQFHYEGFKKFGANFDKADGFLVKNTIEKEGPDLFKFDYDVDKAIAFDKENMVGDTFYVREPNQIKSATSNVGTFSEESPSIMFQTPIDEAFDKSQALLDAMSKRGGIITNLVVRFADRSSSLKKKLIEANLKNARDLFVAQAGAGSRAKFFIDENFSPIYNGLNKENSEYLDKIIQLRRIIQIDEDFDSKGKPRIIHPSDKNGVPLNKERAEANLVDYESMFGSALYNDLINRSDLYFDAYKKLLSIMRDNGLITKELYDNLKSLLYQPRKFLDQFVSFEEGETTLDVKDLALNEAQIKTLQNGSDSEIMMNSKLLLAFSAKSVFSRVARNKTYTAISEAVKDPANDWISNKQLKNFKPVNYFVDGVREQFFIREDYQKQLYDSTRHLISPNVARVMRVLTGSAILKSFATQVNPLFALKNFPRDVLHVAMFTNIYGNNLYPALFRISRDAFRGMHDKMSNSKDFKEWLEYGGGMDFLSTEGFESRSVRVGAFNKIRDAMSTFGEYSEVGVRLAVYKKTKADLTDEFVKTNGRGPNKEESDTIKTQAAVASREIIDFAQGGSWAKAGENIIPYLNASIQGFRVGANYIVKNPKDFAVKFAQLSLAVGVIMFYNSMMADDDEWEKIQDGEKMRNFIIFTPFKDKDGNRYYIKIAKTQQAIAWITFAEMMSAKMLNETLNPDDDEKIADKYKIYGDRTYDALVDGLMTFFPKNPLDLKKEITSAIPAINALAAVNNYDTFINKQVSYDYQKVPAVYEDILDPDIPYFYKALSQSIHPVMEIGPKRLGTAVEKITTGAETSVIVAGAYYLLDNVARKVANLKTDELNLGEVPKGDSELNAISSMFSPLKGVVKKVNPNLKKYQYSEDLDDIALRGASSIKTIKNASRNLGEKYYDALRGQGDLTKDEVLKEVKDYRDMLIEKGVQKSQVESFVNAFKMSAKSSPRESWDAGYYDIMYSPSSDATVEIISKLKGDNLTDAELKEYFINYKKSTGYNIKNMGEVYSLYRKSRDKK